MASQAQEEMFKNLMTTMFSNFIKTQPNLAAQLAKQSIPQPIAQQTPPKKRKSPKSKRKNSAKKKRSPKHRTKSPKRDLRTRLSTVLLPLVDKHICRNSTTPKFFKSSGASGNNFFDEREFEPYSNTAIRLVLGLCDAGQMDTGFKLCKSIVKNRQFYLKSSKDPTLHHFKDEQVKKQAKTELKRQVEMMEAGEVKAASESSDGAADSSDGAADSSDDKYDFSADDLFASSQDRSPLRPELADLKFDDDTYQSCAHVGCDAVLATHECFPETSRGTSDAVWCRKHWGEHQRQLRALERYKNKKRQSIKDNYKKKMAETTAKSPKSKVTTSTKSPKVKKKSKGATAKPPKSKAATTAKSPKSKAAAKSPKSKAATTAKPPKSKSTVVQGPNDFFKFSTTSIVTCEWPVEKNHLTMRIVSGDKPLYDVYFQQDGKVRKNVPEKQIKLYTPKEGDRDDEVYAAHRSEHVGSTFELKQRRRYLQRGHKFMEAGKYRIVGIGVGSKHINDYLVCHEEYESDTLFVPIFKVLQLLY